MADDNDNASSSDKKKYLRIAAFWRNGRMFRSQNLQKRIDSNNNVQVHSRDYKEKAKENEIRLTLMGNQFKEDSMSRDADAHLLLDVEKFDEFLEYLHIVKADYDARMESDS